MKNKFQKLVNCVILPQKGRIPLTAQISGSDLDGDNFFVCWD
jgi:RNA-dependent RNA polymerase